VGLAVIFRRLGAGVLSLALVVGVSAPASAEPELLATLTAETSPRFSAVSPDGTRLYVSNTASSSVTVFDTSTRLAVGHLTLPSNPHRLTVSPNGNTLYVGDFTNGRVWAVDVRTDSPTISETIPPTGTLGGTGIRGLAVRPDGQKLYVAVGHAYTVAVIDTSNTLSRSTFGPFPSGLAGQNFATTDQIVFSPDGSKAYVSFSKGSFGTGAAGVISLETTNNTLVERRVFSENLDTSIEAKPSGLAITSDGRYLYVADYGTGPRAGVGKYDLTVPSMEWLNTPVALISGSAPEFLALTADNSTLFIGGSGTTPLRIADTASHTVSKSINLGVQTAQVTTHPARNTRYAFVGSWNPSTSVFIVGTEATPDPENAAQAVAADPRIGLDFRGRPGRGVEGIPVDLVGLDLPVGSIARLTVFQPETRLFEQTLAGRNLNETVRLPGGLPPGIHTLVYTVTLPSGEVLSLNRTIEISAEGLLLSVGDNQVGPGPSVAPAEPRKLAYTGVQSTSLPWWALLSLGMGLLLVLYSIRAVRMVEQMVIAIEPPREKTPWEILATPIRVPGIDYTPGSSAQSGEAQSLTEAIHDLDVALSRLIAKRLTRGSQRYAHISGV